MFYFWPESIRGSGGYAAINKVSSFHFHLRSDSEPGEFVSVTQSVERQSGNRRDFLILR